MEATAEATRWIKDQARQLGFDDVGIARADIAPHAQRFRDALAEGRLDPIPYLHERVEERLDPRVLLPGAQSVIIVLMGYADERPDPPDEPHFKVARYAARRDYHNPFIKKLRTLRKRMKAQFPGSDAYVAADTGAVLERAWAERAGLGWIGKSAMLLSRKHGTYTLLGSMITTLALDPDPPGVDHCGTCTACMDACPTGAIVQAGMVDPRRCITSYTVECFDDVMPAHAPDFHGWIFGCDVCQQVCPYQGRGTVNPSLAARNELAFLKLSAVQKENFPSVDGTPLARAGVKRLVRNARHS